jgi:hypothetical protein
MGFFDLFRRPPPVDTLPALDDFLDSQAAFLVQKCIFEYARARSGILSEKLFKEPAFVAAVEASRWQNYPICLGHVALMIDAALRPYASDRAPALADGFVAAIARVTRRYPVPAGMAPDFWASARKAIDGRIRRASLAAPHAVKDIPKDEFKAFFARLPIHESLRGHDYVLVRNNLRINLCRAHETFLARMDAPALVALLTGASETAAAAADHAAG